MNLTVVAEGVESDAPLAFLRAEGCDFIQGFLVQQPLEHNDASAFVAGAQVPASRRGHA